MIISKIFPVQLKVVDRCEAIVNGIRDAITDESVENLAGRERNAAGGTGMKIMTRYVLLTSLMLFCLAARAESPPAPVPDDPPPPPMPLPESVPPPPSGVSGDEELQPEVKITKRGEDIIYEYRVNNQLYMVKVVPRIGYPYYLVDQDGNGSLESRFSNLEPNLVVPRWILYRW